jgi:hypothetical protein
VFFTKSESGPTALEAEVRVRALLSGFGRLPMRVDSIRIAEFDNYKKAQAISNENIGDLGAVLWGRM